MGAAAAGAPVAVLAAAGAEAVADPAAGLALGGAAVLTLSFAPLVRGNQCRPMV